METIHPSVPFDPFAIPFGSSDVTYGADFSPVSLFGPLDERNAGPGSDSAGSPTSPVSPSALSGSSYGFPTSEDWASWDQSPASDGPFSPVAFGGPLLGPLLGSTPMHKRPMTPAVNPLDLTVLPGGAQSSVSAASVYQAPRPGPATVPPLFPMPDPPVIPFYHHVASKRYPSRTLKRKSSASASEEEAPAYKRGSPSPPPMTTKLFQQLQPKKTAHNMIEKRYRTNLNDKISQLRDAVPALRGTGQRYGHSIGNGDDGDEACAEEDGAGLGPVPKLNKATILSKAAEYIVQLERRNQTLETENGALRGRMEGLEILLMSRGGSTGAWN